MDKNELLEELKRVVSGGATNAPRAQDDAVTADVTPRFDPTTGRLALDVVLKAASGRVIENHSNGLLYFVEGGKGTGRTSRWASSWGVEAGTEIRSGVGIAVAEKGSHSGKWTVGTFLRTDQGYSLWTKSGDFEFPG